MPGFVKKTLSGLGLAVACTASIGCEGTAAVPPRAAIRITDNATLTKALAEEYQRLLQDLDITVVTGSVERLERGEADLGFALADRAYLNHLARATNPEGSGPGVRAMAAVQVAPLHVVVRRGSGIATIPGLRGQRVRYAGPEILTRGPHANDLVDAVFAGFGVTPQMMTLQTRTAIDALAALSPGELDAVVTFAVLYPSPHVHAAMAEGASLVPIEGPIVDRLRNRYPFLRYSRIPPGTYPGQTQAVHTIGVDLLLVCRPTLDSRLVYRLTKAFFDAAERLSSASASMRLADLSDSSATPIPLHDGAAQYYRERELIP